MVYKAVIFDLFGTLVDNLRAVEYDNVLSQMAAKIGVARTEFIQCWHDSYHERMSGHFPTPESNILHICKALGVLPGTDQIRAAIQARVDYVQRALVPRKGAVETIRAIKKAGLKIGLISDCSWETPLLWKQTAFAGLFDEAIFSCAVGLKKPDPRIYLLACERLEVSPQDCLYVGDGSSHELTGAAAVGMSPLLIRVPYEANDDSETRRIDEDDWQGPAIAALEEVLRYALDG